MRKAFALAAIATLLLCLGNARAQVRDDGKFFSRQAVQQADDAIGQLKQSTGRDLLIETYPNIPQERAGNYRPDNQAAFFRQWSDERATAAHVKGVYILINRNPAYLLITPEDRVKQREFTAADSKQLRDQMLPMLKQKQFDQVLSTAVDFVSARFRERVQAGTEGSAGGGTTYTPPSPPSGGHYSQPANAPSAPSRGFGIGALIIVAILIFIGFKVLRALFRGRAGYGSGSYYGGGYGPGYGGGGFGRGFLGGILGGMAGGWLQNRMSHRNDPGSAMGAPPPDTGGSFGNSSDDVSFTGGGDAGGSFDSGPSDSGSSDSGSSGDDGSSGGAF